MSEISSGLVAFCYMSDQYEVALFSEPPTDPLYDDMFPLVRLSDAEAILSAKDAEIERLERESSSCDLLDEQKGTITALNMALGGEDSTSTENLIDAHDIDYNEEGLISLCRKLIAENVRLSDVIESTAINDTIEALGFANREIERLTTSENDWITCHAKIWRELQETKTIVGNQAERISDLEASHISEEVIDILRSKIKALESEILEQCRINGIGAERELHLLAQVAAKDAEIERLKHKPTIEDADTTVDHLRAYAADNGYSHGDYADVMSEAASQIEQQAERIKELEAHTTTLEEVIASQRENVTSLATEVVDKDAEIERLKQTPTIEDAKTTVEHLRAYAADNGYSHGDYADVMTEAANQIEKQAERIKALESEILEQCRLNGMGAERELALLGQIERQSAALKLAKDAIVEIAHVLVGTITTSYDMRRIALSAIDALGEVK